MTEQECAADPKGVFKCHEIPEGKGVIPPESGSSMDNPSFVSQGSWEFHGQPILCIARVMGHPVFQHISSLVPRALSTFVLDIRAPFLNTKKISPSRSETLTGSKDSAEELRKQL